MPCCAFLVMFAASRAGAQTGDTAQLFEEAVTAQRGGDNAEAIRKYRQILKAKPDLLPAWINLGVASVQAGQFAEGIESYRKALGMDPTNRTVQTYLALAFFKQGDTATALRGFEELYKADPRDVRVATLLAACALRGGDAKWAHAVLEPFAETAADTQDYTWAMSDNVGCERQTARWGRGGGARGYNFERGGSVDAGGPEFTGLERVCARADGFGKCRTVELRAAGSAHRAGAGAREEC